MTTLEALGVSGPRRAVGELDAHTVVRLPVSGRVGYVVIARVGDGGDGEADGEADVATLIEIQDDAGDVLAALAPDAEVEVLYTPRQLALLYLRFGRVRDAVNHTTAALRLVRRAVAEAAEARTRSLIVVRATPSSSSAAAHKKEG